MLFAVASAPAPVVVVALAVAAAWTQRFVSQGPNAGAFGEKVVSRRRVFLVAIHARVSVQTNAVAQRPCVGGT